MEASAREHVRQRANKLCEYCRLDQQHSALSHHVEHIVAKQHGGSDNYDNLALACHRCNHRKGPNLTGIDPESSEVVPLFHPRRQVWAEHFIWQGVRIQGTTPIGRATVQVLAMNDSRRIELRTELLARGEHKE